MRSSLYAFALIAVSGVNAGPTTHKVEASGKTEVCGVTIPQDTTLASFKQFYEDVAKEEFCEDTFQDTAVYDDKSGDGCIAGGGDAGKRVSLNFDSTDMPHLKLKSITVPLDQNLETCDDKVRVIVSSQTENCAADPGEGNNLLDTSVTPAVSVNNNEVTLTFAEPASFSGDNPAKSFVVMTSDAGTCKLAKIESSVLILVSEPMGQSTTSTSADGGEGEGNGSDDSGEGEGNGNDDSVKAAAAVTFMAVAGLAVL